MDFILWSVLLGALGHFCMDLFWKQHLSGIMAKWQFPMFYQVRQLLRRYEHTFWSKLLWWHCCWNHFCLIIQIHLKYNPVRWTALVKMTNFHLMIKTRLWKRLGTRWSGIQSTLSHGLELYLRNIKIYELWHILNMMNFSLSMNNYMKEQLHEDYTEGLSKLECSAAFAQLVKMNDIWKRDITGSSRTSGFWLQYCDFVKIQKQFIPAEWIGNWKLHLSLIGNIINLFAATGHVHYAKSARVYLQEMCELPVKFPLVYEQFSKKGLHSVPCSNTYWVELSLDLVIEQAQMQPIKTRGGLTRGRNITHPVWTIYVNSMHQCSMTHQAMGSLSQIRHDNEKTHVEVRTGWQIRPGNVDNMVLAEKSLWSSWWIIEKLMNRSYNSFWMWCQVWQCWSSRLSHKENSQIQTFKTL